MHPKEHGGYFVLRNSEKVMKINEIAMKFLCIFALLSFNSMAKKINNIALATLSLHGIGTQQPISGGKGTRICGIYKITSPTGKIYIGQSIDCLKRESNYKNQYCKNQTKLYNSIKKYGWDKHTLEVIHICNRDELNKLEVYYIELHQCFNSEYGMNLKGGGHGGGIFSNESLLKLRKGGWFNCLTCGDSFYRQPAFIKKGDNKFCSRECCYTYRKGKKLPRTSTKKWNTHPANSRVDKNCIVCGNKYSVKLSHSNSSKYCSIKCRTKWHDFK